MPQSDQGNQLTECTEKVKGTYILLLHLGKATSIKIGALGTFDFPQGWYAYVGSAFGPGGLHGRLKHHLATIRKAHWHIDYLRQYALCREVWYLVSEGVNEHKWAEALQSMPEAKILVPRFGASDCKCKTHMIYFAERPDFEEFCAVVGEDICSLAIQIAKNQDDLGL